jgi:beta-N-acetylglucosaminidase
MKRRLFVTGLGTFALSKTVAWGKSLPLLNSLGNSFALAVPMDMLRPFHVMLPGHIETLPFGSDRSGSRPAFALRGIKGWAWSPDQYLLEIPVMAKYRLNFLMNDYGSLWDLGPHGTWQTDRSMNFWYRPLSVEKRAAFEKVIRLCQQYGITFCFSVNPNLRSDRPFDYNSAEDLNALWQHYTWAQSLGVKWFNVSLDDISYKIDAAGQASLLNAIFHRLRAQDPEAQLTFCPTWYAGTGDSGTETNTTLGIKDRLNNDPVSEETPGVRYTRTLAKQLDRDVYLFWTGPDVCSLTIDADQARRYKALCGHRVLLWDNYPVNDQQPTLHLGPLTGRSADLCSIVDGSISNPMAYQDEANRIPLLTVADYLWNPEEYDSGRSIGQAIAHLGNTKVRRELLHNLAELYPGRLWDRSDLTGWNSLRERFNQFIQRGEKREARRLLAKAQTTLRQMKATFSDTWSSGAEVLQDDVNAMVSIMGEK